MSLDTRAGVVGGQETVETLQDQQESVVEPVLESYIHFAATSSQAARDRRPTDPGTSHCSCSTRWSVSNFTFFFSFPLIYYYLLRFSEDRKHTGVATKGFGRVFTKRSTLDARKHKRVYALFFLFPISTSFFFSFHYYYTLQRNNISFILSSRAAATPNVQTTASLTCDWTGCVVPVTLVCVVPLRLILRMYLWNAPCTSTLAKQNSTDTHRPCDQTNMG